VHPRCSARLAAARPRISVVGRFTELPFSEPSSAAVAVNRRHEHSATAAERFRSGRHRSDGGTRAWPKVPLVVGDRAGYPRETGRRNRKRSERKKEGSGKIKDARERNHAGTKRAYSRDCTGCLRLVAGPVERRNEGGWVPLKSRLRKRGPLANVVVIGVQTHPL